MMRHIGNGQSGCNCCKTGEDPGHTHRDLICDDPEKKVDSKRIPSGIPDKFFDLSSHFEIIQKENSMKDENLNERIQREGVHFSGKSTQDQPLTGDEAEWYVRHKGYSKRINYE
jgi:hypothetical protein